MLNIILEYRVVINEFIIQYNYIYSSNPLPRAINFISQD